MSNMIGSLEWMAMEFELAETSNRQMTNVALRADDGQRGPYREQKCVILALAQVFSRMGGLDDGSMRLYSWCMVLGGIQIAVKFPHRVFLPFSA